jgi:hypothetical protein
MLTVLSAAAAAAVCSLLCLLQEPQGTQHKAKWKYLQKYWHKGAFFQSGADDARGTAGAAGCVCGLVCGRVLRSSTSMHACMGER